MQHLIQKTLWLHHVEDVERHRVLDQLLAVLSFLVIVAFTVISVPNFINSVTYCLLKDVETQKKICFIEGTNFWFLIWYFQDEDAHTFLLYQLTWMQGLISILQKFVIKNVSKGLHPVKELSQSYRDDEQATKANILGSCVACSLCTYDL